MKLLLGVIIASVYTWALVCAVAYPPITVSTAQGSVTGYVTPAHRIFQGIPFAKPPVDTLRFKPPQAAATRTKTINVTKTAPACDVQEDCLYLDIYVPVGVTTNAAVMIWIHGGSYISGKSASYSGNYITNNTNTIFVPINYRLGAFGFLALNETFTRDGTTGNYGMQDQRFAIQWVKANIQKFGGSTSKITIAGESAGAFSICSLLESSRSQGLFRAAIIESSYENCNLRTLTSAISAGNSYAAKFGCSGTGDARLSCVMAADASDIYASFVNDQMTDIWRPCSDNYEFTNTNGFTNIKALPKVPLLVGTNSGENSPGTFGCTAEGLANLLAPYVPVYVYYFAQGPAQHADELPYFYHPTNVPSASQTKLSHQMVDYWINFVENLVPTSTAPGAIAWPAYNVSARNYIVLNNTLSIGSNFGQAQKFC